jgi:hypothetical protein
MVSKLIKLLIIISLVYSSCQKKPQKVDADILTKEQFISKYRLHFFLSFLSLATNNTIGKSLDSLNDWSYQGDGGFLPRKYNEQADSLAKQYFAKADRTVYNPGEKPRTYFIAELEKATSERTLDSLAAKAYLEYLLNDR